MIRADLLTAEALEAAGEYAYAMCRLRGGDVFMTPWPVLHAETRALMRLIAASAINAAWTAAEAAEKKNPVPE